MHLWPSTLATFFYVIPMSSAIHVSLPRPESPFSNVFRRTPNNTSSTLHFDGYKYTIDIVLGGRSFSVMLDTGSADLWVAGTVPEAKDTGYTAWLSYAIGIFDGTVKNADLTIAGHTVTNQTFLEVAPSSDAPEGTGFIGLGPSSASTLRHSLNSSTADNAIDRILQKSRPTQNFITLQLARLNDTRDNYTSEMTIGEILPQHHNITNQPKIPVTIFPSDDSEYFQQHFGIYLDVNGITGPDGKPIPTNSTATTAPNYNPHRFHVVLDSGFTLAQLPEEVVAAVYSGLKGAQLISFSKFSGNVWKIPCDVQIQHVKIMIAGHSFPIHPLDLSRKDIDDNGNPFCFGTLQPAIPGSQNLSSTYYDGILGMAILTNMYCLMNYGNFTNGNTAEPYVQCLSTTDSDNAHAEFITQRLGGKGTTGSNKSRIGIIAVAVAVVAALAVAGVVWLLRRRNLAYRSLNEPAPAGDLTMQSVAGYNAGAQYADLWTRRSSLDH